jgi:hypothetical protein
MTNPAMLRLDTAPPISILPHTESITMLGPSGEEEEIEKARERAEQNETTLYDELENDGYTTGQIKEAFQDYIDSDPDLRAFGRVAHLDGDVT